MSYSRSQSTSPIIPRVRGGEGQEKTAVLLADLMDGQCRREQHLRRNYIPNQIYSCETSSSRFTVHGYMIRRSTTVIIISEMCRQVGRVKDSGWAFGMNWQITMTSFTLRVQVRERTFVMGDWNIAYSLFCCTSRDMALSDNS